MSKKAIALFTYLLVAYCSFGQNAATISFNTSTLRESLIVGYSRTFHQKEPRNRNRFAFSYQQPEFPWLVNEFGYMITAGIGYRF